MKKLPQIISEMENNKDREVLSTGFPHLDEFLDGGFFKKELIALGAQTGKGKSMIAGTLFQTISAQGFKSAYFSLELSSEVIAARLIGQEAGIKYTRILYGFLDQIEYNKKTEAKAKLCLYEDLMYFYDDLYVLAEITKEIEANQYEFIVIDFIQNIICGKDNEYERLSFVALELQKLAKKMNCCILVLSQLSNMVSREIHKDIVEYRGSGSIATVCDLGLFVEQSQSPKASTVMNSFAIKIRKNRRGISGMAFDFSFHHEGGRITEL